MEKSNRFGYRRLRALHLAAAAVTAGVAIFIGWLALHHHNTLADVWLILGLLGFGTAGFVAGGLYVGCSSLVLSEEGIVERQPLRPERAIPWGDVAQITRFESERETDIVPASGAPKMTVNDGIDRFEILQQALVDRAAERYSVQPRRPGRLPAWVPAVVIVGFVAIYVVIIEYVLPGRVTVVVTDARGAALPGATVFFINKRYPQGEWRVGPDGRVEKRLPAARYTLAVASPPHRDYRADVEIARFETQTFEIRLERE